MVPKGPEGCITDMKKFWTLLYVINFLRMIVLILVVNLMKIFELV